MIRFLVSMIINNHEIVGQKYDWDCGIACLEMAIKWWKADQIENVKIFYPHFLLSFVICAYMYEYLCIDIIIVNMDIDIHICIDINIHM